MRKASTFCLRGVICLLLASCLGGSTDTGGTPPDSDTLPAKTPTPKNVVANSVAGGFVLMWEGDYKASSKFDCQERLDGNDWDRCSNCQNVAEKPQFRCTPLSESKTYRIQAKNLDYDWSDWSEEVTVPHAPTAPLNFEIRWKKDRGKTMYYRLSWDRPRADGSGSSRDLTWEFQRGMGDSFTSWEPSEAEDGCVAILDEESGAYFCKITNETDIEKFEHDKYNYKVRAANDTFKGEWSFEARETDETLNPPRNFDVTSDSGVNKISWSSPKPLEEGNYTHLGYIIQYQKGEKGPWGPLTGEGEYFVSRDEASTDHEGLLAEENVEYTYRISAKYQSSSNINELVYSDWVDSDSIEVHAGPPSEVERPSVKSANGVNTISWSAATNNGSPITGYVVSYKKKKIDGSWTDNWEEACTTTGETWEREMSCEHTGLSQNDEYIYHVTATNAIGPSTPSPRSTPHHVVAGVPGPPTIFLVTSKDGTNDISWRASKDNGSPVTGYTVQWSKADTHGNYGHYSNLAGCVGTTNLSCAHANLVGGDEYTYRVRAANVVGDSVWAISQKTVESSLPSAPEDMAVTPVPGMNKVTWSASIPKGSVITGYKVEFVKEDGSGGIWGLVSGCLVNDTSLRKCDHGGLLKDDVYSYRVKALTEDSSGDWAFTRDITVIASPPSAPKSAQATSSEGEIAITWNQASPNGYVITGYTVEFAKKDTLNDTYGNWTAVSGCATDDATLRTCNHLGLVRNDVYKYRISAAYSGGQGAWAGIGDTTVVAAAPATIGQPSITSANGINTITWTAPANNGSTITGYTVWFKRNTSLGWTSDWAQACTTTGETSCDHTGLSKDDEYKYYITATNGIGSSTPSQESPTQTVVAGVPGVPSALLVTSADGTNDISWGASEQNGSPVTGYTVQWSKADASGDYGSYTNLAGCVGATNLSCAHVNLVGGDKYKYQVKATNIIGDSAWAVSDEITVDSSAPSAPGNMAVESNAGINTITWTGSVPNGSVITGYEVEFVKEDGSDDVWAPVSGCSVDDATLRTCEHLGLIKDNVYSYRVRAMARDATGDWAIKRDITVAASVPSISTPLVSTASGENTITWTAPANNGSPITGYTVQWSKADATGDFNSFSDLTGCVDVLTLSCAHSGLIDGDRYKYQIKATNIMGDSAWSMSGEVVVASLPPSDPGNAQATSSAGVTTITWNLASPNGSVITGYMIEFAKKDVSNDVYGNWTAVFRMCDRRCNSNDL